MSSTVYIIDGSAFIYRAFHAVAPLTNSEGFQTNAVFGFINILRRLIKERNPDYVAVAFDTRGPVFRHEMYKEYKANRPPMPGELAAQIPYIKQVVQAMGVVSFEKQELEADDLIGSAAETLAAQDHQVIIVSGDKDLLQLVNDRVTMWDPMNDRVMDREGVYKKYQVYPEQLLDCFALIGDSSDNVPGVPSVGPKSAAKLIDQFGSLDTLYAEIDTLKKSKMKERLIENRDNAFLSRELIRLKNDPEIPSDIDDYKRGTGDEESLKSIYSELGFSSLLKELDNGIVVPSDGFMLINTNEQLEELDAILSQSKLLVIDTETTSLDVRAAELVGVSLAVDLESCYYIPVGHRSEDGTRVDCQLSLDAVTGILTPYLVSDAVTKVGHNLKYDYGILKRTMGVPLGGPLVDTMIAAHIAEPLRRSFKLDDLCQDQGLKLTPYQEVTAGDKREDAFAYVDIKEACHYSCEDVYGTLVLWEYYREILEHHEQMSLFTDVEMMLVPILEEMESTGIMIDEDRLSDLADEFDGKLQLLEKEIFSLAGHEFNINSPRQLGTVLFDELQLPHGRKTKTGYSTDIKVLEKLAAKHELPACIIKYRNLAKLLSTYVEKLRLLITPESKRIHTSFNQAVTATGRLSSSNPNLQNIPIRGEEGNRIREAFVPAPDKIFLSADYSQIDLRVLAHYSQDDALLEAFRHGDDIHTRTAAEIFGVSPLLVASDMRRAAKSINFGIVYGMSSFGLANQLKISRKEAQTFIDRYFGVYGGVKQYMTDIVKEARADGYVSTLLNRRRYLPEIDASNKMRREFAERAAINTPIQGTAADIIKLAMLRVESLLKREKSSCRMLLQIHDELVFELSEEECERIQHLIRQEMEQAMELDVPLVVNMETGKSLAKGG